jgi:hypothetical protein
MGISRYGNPEPSGARSRGHTQRRWDLAVERPRPAGRRTAGSLGRTLARVHPGDAHVSRGAGGDRRESRMGAPRSVGNVYAQRQGVPAVAGPGELHRSACVPPLPPSRPPRRARSPPLRHGPAETLLGGHGLGVEGGAARGGLAAVLHRCERPRRRGEAPQRLRAREVLAAVLAAYRAVGPLAGDPPAALLEDAQRPGEAARYLFPPTRVPGCANRATSGRAP